MQFIPNSPYYANTATEGQVQKFNHNIIIQLQQIQKFAHVALDLTLIAGLTTVAVALATMQGVSDLNVLSAISVLFLLLGTIAHLSHMMRLVHVYIPQTEASANHNVGVQRVMIIVVSFFILVLYCTLADTPLVEQDNLLMQKIVFAVMTFLIFWLSDLIMEAQSCRSTAEEILDKCERFWDYVRKKNAITASMILLTVLVMTGLRATTVLSASVSRQYRTTTVRDTGALSTVPKIYEPLTFWWCWVNTEPT